MTMHTPDEQTSVNRWLEKVSSESPDFPVLSAEPLTPPPSFSGHSSASPAQRKRTRNTPELPSQSPQKRQRTLRDDDNICPDQSASDIAVTELSGRTRRSHPSHSIGSSPKRTTSPVRDLLSDLRVSKPAILCEIPSTTTLPERAAALQRSVMDCLDEKLIPLGLKVMISDQPKEFVELANKDLPKVSNPLYVSFCSGEYSDLRIRQLGYAISARPRYTMELC